MNEATRMQVNELFRDHDSERRFIPYVSMFEFETLLFSDAKILSHKLISRADVAVYIWGSNATWLLFPLLGLYVSIRLIVDGDYTVLGYR